jgi:hypothetical protein
MMAHPSLILLLFACANAGAFSVAELNSYKQANDL